MNSRSVPPLFPFLERISKAQKQLEELKIDALLIENTTNLYYLTGIELSSGKLLIAKEHCHLIVDGRYYEQCQKTSPVPVLPGTPLQELFQQSFYQGIRLLGFDSETTPYKNFLELQKITSEITSDLVACPLILVPLENPIKLLRSVKDASEIALLKEAAEVGLQGFDFACSLLKEGISEIEIALELEIYWKKLGVRKVAFDPIIAFGANTSMPHYRAGEATLKYGQPVLIDIGVNRQRYHSDMTRTVFFGEPSPELRVIYDIVKEAQSKALEACRPGITCGELDALARKIISDKDYGKFFSHSLGHGVGLEIHEFPSLANKPPFQNVKLAPGMVITIEPGIYLPDIGGVRIEDTILITNKGHENLTNRTKELKIIETNNKNKTMNK